MAGRAIAAAVALSLVSGGSVTTARAWIWQSCSNANGIFTETSRLDPIDPDPSRVARRSRRVQVNLRRVFSGNSAPTTGSAAKSLDLNLFPDLCLKAVRDAASDVGGKVEWVGRVKDLPNTSVILIVDRTLMVGTITLERDTFRIRYLGDGVHVVTDIDQAAFPRD